MSDRDKFLAAMHSVRRQVRAQETVKGVWNTHERVVWIKVEHFLTNLIEDRAAALNGVTPATPEEVDIP